MTAFFTALTRLFGDPNLAVDATYEPAEGAPISVRLIARRADAITDFGGGRLWSETARFDLRVAEIANPRPATGSSSPANASLCRASQCGIASGWSGRWT